MSSTAEDGIAAAARHVRLCHLGFARSRKLLLARDRFGKKPLYYAVLPEGLYFAQRTEVPARPPAIPLDLDPEALRLYFQFSYIPDPLSPFEQVRKLEPGTWLELRREGHVRRGRYWTLPPPAESRTPSAIPNEPARDSPARCSTNPCACA